MIDLKKLDNVWQATAAGGTAMDRLPEGDYQVRIETARIAESSNGTPLMNWGLRVISGQYANRMIFKSQRIVEEGLPYLKADLELLHVCPQMISELEGVLQYTLDAILDVRLKNVEKKDGSLAQNVYFNRMIRPGGLRESNNAAAKADANYPWE